MHPILPSGNWYELFADLFVKYWDQVCCSSSGRPPDTGGKPGRRLPYPPPRGGVNLWCSSCKWQVCYFLKGFIFLCRVYQAEGPSCVSKYNFYLWLVYFLQRIQNFARDCVQNAHLLLYAGRGQFCRLSMELEIWKYGFLFLFPRPRMVFDFALQVRRPKASHPCTRGGGQFIGWHSGLLGLQFAWSPKFICKGVGL